MKMKNHLLKLALLPAAALLAGCLAEVGDPRLPLPVTDGELIYGADDRIEYYELGSSPLRAVADATVAVVSASDMSSSGSSWTLDTSTSFGASYNLCSSEPYRDQPSSVFCSGFMVGDDLVATAGHCIDSAGCGSTGFVFGFRMDDASTVRSTFPDDDVYWCDGIVARVETSTNDFAVVRVDRQINGHQPLALRRSGSVSLGDPLVLSGHPAGIPLKIAGGATVRASSHPNYFEANVDAYGGNSGSPVVNASTLEVEGILVRGNTDFVRIGRGRNRCYVSNECNDSGCPGWEDITRTSAFEAFVPDGPGCLTNADCDDLDPCNGVEVCDGGTEACVSGSDVDCGDSNACTTDACVATSQTTWTCDNTAVTCNDGDACTVDFCDPVTGCGSTPVVCGVDEVCDGGACVPVPVCGLKNDPCSSNSDCCSGRCRTRQGRCR